MSRIYDMTRISDRTRSFIALTVLLAALNFVLSVQAGTDWVKDWRKLGSATVTF